MKEKVLVTGANGFLGRQVCLLLRNEYFVIAANTGTCDSAPGMQNVVVDTSRTLGHYVVEYHPSKVVHCAFVNRKPPGLSDGEYVESILKVNMEFFSACSRARAKVLLVSSSAVYGEQPTDDIISEDCGMRPISIYGVAKAVQEMLGHYYAAQGMELCVARLFNLCGPGQPPGTVMADWVRQVCDIDTGAEPVVYVRTLCTNRDFVDVRDAARAIMALVAQFHSGETINIASGVAVSLREVNEELSRLCSVPYRVVETSAGCGGGGVRFQRGSFDRIRRAWGWEPAFTWRQSLSDLWTSYRQDRTV